MLSRVANPIFWMSRCLERAENAARLIETRLYMILDLPSLREDSNAWKPLVDITGDGDYFSEKLGAPTRENVMFFHTFDGAYPHSIKSCLTAARILFKRQQPGHRLRNLCINRGGRCVIEVNDIRIRVGQLPGSFGSTDVRIPRNMLSSFLSGLARMNSRRNRRIKFRGLSGSRNLESVRTCSRCT
jgi:hypothetical protein